MVLASPFSEHEPEASRPLVDAGCQIEHGPTDHLPDEDELIELLAGCQVSVASSERYTERVFQSLPDLRMVARWGVGYDCVDIPAATAAGVAVANTPGMVTEFVADQTFCLLLGLTRRLPEQIEVAQQPVVAARRGHGDLEQDHGDHRLRLHRAGGGAPGPGLLDARAGL